MGNALDLRRQRLESVGHFVVIFVLIVNAPHAANDVTKCTLGNVGVDPCPAH